MKITRKQVLNVSKYIECNHSFYFPFKVICSDFDKEDECSEMNCLDFGYDYIDNNKLMNRFILIENLQDLRSDTVELMAKGFLDKVEYTPVIDKILDLAIEYRKNWKEQLCESEDIEEYGLNEFIGGKADAYEDCVQIIKQKSFSA